MGDWEIEVQNFQSIKKAKITVSSGLNIITGKTNSGKSAIFRAVDSAIFNTGTDDLVKAGTKIAGVSIKANGHTMQYCRNAEVRNEKVAYQFDGGNVQRKVGRAQLPEVQKYFGIRDIRMQNNVKVKLNFWYQNDKPFLMDKTAGQLYEFLSISSADKYFKVLKSMSADLKVQEAEINNSNTVIDTLKTINNQKTDFVNQNKDFDVLYTKVIKSSGEADKLNYLLGIVTQLSTLRLQIDEVRAKLDDIDKVYKKIPIGAVSDKYTRMSDIYTNYLKFYDMALGISKNKKQMSDITKLYTSCGEEYKELSKACNKVDKKVKSLDATEILVSEIFKKVSGCNNLLDNIGVVNQRIISLKEVSNIDLLDLSSRLEKITLVTASCSSVGEVLSRLNSLGSSMSNLGKTLSSCNQSLQEAENEFNDYKVSVGYCPFCGSVFSEGHIH